MIFLALGVLTSLFSFGSAEPAPAVTKTSNAQRFARGLPPLRPANLYSPTRVRAARDVPSPGPTTYALSDGNFGKTCTITNYQVYANDGSSSFYVTTDCLNEAGSVVTTTIGIQYCFNINTQGHLVCQQFNGFGGPASLGFNWHCDSCDLIGSNLETLTCTKCDDGNTIHFGVTSNIDLNTCITNENGTPVCVSDPSGAF